MDSLKERLKKILIRDQLITPADFEKALEAQKTSGGALSKILVQQNLISEDSLTQVLSEGLGLPQISISRLNIDSSMVRVIPKDIAVKYQIMPVSLMGDTLTLAMADPLNIFVIDNVKTVTGYTINPIICRPREIEKAIQKYYAGSPEGEKAQETSETFEKLFAEIKDTGDLEFIKESGRERDQGLVEELGEDAPIIKLTDTIIQQAAVLKASDVFIEPLEKTVRIRYRIDGVIREADRLAKGFHFPLVSRIKVICNLDISEHRLPQDGRFKTVIGGRREIDFRVNVLPTVFGEKVVLRVLESDTSLLHLDKLGFEEEALRRLKECSLQPHGMILTCGPTGSGKTTTLYSILKFIDSPERNIVTVEDPVEYQMKGINQVNVKPAVGLTFSSSLRSILRQDPDVILIGEIRDSETLDIAVKAALTGHLVLSSLHTTTAAGSVIRMMNMGIEPFLICSSVLVIVAQRLLRRICPFCKEAYAPSNHLIDRLEIKHLVSKREIQFFHGKGCAKCLKSGYIGRAGITEILVLSPHIKELILSRAGEFKVKEAARAEGMKTMREDGLIKAVNGTTTLEEVLRVTGQDES